MYNKVNTAPEAKIQVRTESLESCQNVVATLNFPSSAHIADAVQSLHKVTRSAMQNMQESGDEETTNDDILVVLDLLQRLMPNVSIRLWREVSRELMSETTETTDDGNSADI